MSIGAGWPGRPGMQQVTAVVMQPGPTRSTVKQVAGSSTSTRRLTCIAKGGWLAVQEARQQRDGALRVRVLLVQDEPDVRRIAAGPALIAQPAGRSASAVPATLLALVWPSCTGACSLTDHSWAQHLASTGGTIQYKPVGCSIECAIPPIRYMECQVCLLGDRAVSSGGAGCVQQSNVAHLLLT
jgi:hypothetical protein